MAEHVDSVVGVRRDCEYTKLKPGEYCYVPERGTWYCRPPWKHAGGDLCRHQVTEHEDGTITVTPSIRIVCGPHMEWEWHGFLERGVWREA